MGTGRWHVPACLKGSNQQPRWAGNCQVWWVNCNWYGRGIQRQCLQSTEPTITTSITTGKGNLQGKFNQSSVPSSIFHLFCLVCPFKQHNGTINNTMGKQGPGGWVGTGVSLSNWGWPNNNHRGNCPSPLVQVWVGWGNNMVIKSKRPSQPVSTRNKMFNTKGRRTFSVHPTS